MSTLVSVENEKISKQGWITWIFCIVANIIDFVDWQLLANVAPLIAKEFQFTSSEMAILLGMPLLGAGVGGVFSGWVSDRIGRVKTMVICIVWFSTFTVFFPFCTSYADLLSFRFLAGLGLGAQWGVGNTLTAEYLPASRRILGSAGIQSGAAWGIIVGAAVVAAIVPQWGWRPVFYFGLIGYVWAFLVLIFLKESDTWLKAKAQHDSGEIRLGDLSLFLRRPYNVRLVLGITLVTLTIMFYWGTSSWIPTWLATEKGLGVVKSMDFLYVLGIGSGLGQLFFGLNAYRWGRKKPAYLCLILGVPCVVIFTSINDPNFLLVFTFVFSFISYSVYGMFGGYISELFPTEIRGTAVNAVWNLGRCICFFGPYIFATIANFTSMSFSIGTAALLYVLALIPLYLLPETKGIVLDNTQGVKAGS